MEEELIYDANLGLAEKRGETRRWGVDVEARAQMCSWLWADADVNLARGRWRDAPREADDIPLAPELTSSGGLTMRAASGVEGGIRYRHLGDRSATADGSLTAQGYTLVSLSCGWELSPFRVQLAIDNLLDTKWREGQMVLESLMSGKEKEDFLRGPAPPPDVHFAPGDPRGITVALTYTFR
ncbi:TonB-dependent receptor domain-containing protein [Candidatus Latescibacterota bacterium]